MCSCISLRLSWAYLSLYKVATTVCYDWTERIDAIRRTGIVVFNIPFKFFNVLFKVVGDSSFLPSQLFTHRKKPNRSTTATEFSSERYYLISPPCRVVY